MSRTTMTIAAWKCIRCNHVWPNNREKKPIRCPDCGSPYWDIPRRLDNPDVKQSISKRTGITTIQSDKVDRLKEPYTPSQALKFRNELKKARRLIK